ncbi:MAG: hypothetical protein ACYTFA_03145 [Planctomycetota bacterium]|jgi:hypothetical protein
MAAQPDSDNSRDRRVDIDLPCISCNYNLRTLRVDGVCPECGEAVAETFHNAVFTARPRVLVEMRTVAGMLIVTKAVAVALPVAHLAGAPILVAMLLPFLVPAAIMEVLFSGVLAEQVRGVLSMTVRYRGILVTGLVWSILCALLFVFGSHPGLVVIPVFGSAAAAPPAWVAHHVRFLGNHVGASGLVALGRVCAWTGFIVLGLWTASLPCIWWFAESGYYTPQALRKAMFGAGVTLVAANLAMWIAICVLLFRLRCMLARILPVAEALRSLWPAEATGANLT